MLFEKRSYPVILSVTGSYSTENAIASGETVKDFCEIVNNIVGREKSTIGDSLLCGIGFNCTPPSVINGLLKNMKNHLQEDILLVCN